VKAWLTATKNADHTPPGLVLVFMGATATRPVKTLVTSRLMSQTTKTTLPLGFKLNREIAMGMFRLISYCINPKFTFVEQICSWVYRPHEAH
jgi:hypothetical protein